MRMRTGCGIHSGLADQTPCVLEALSLGTGVGLAGGDMPAHLAGAPPCKGDVGTRGAVVRVLSTRPGVAVSGQWPCSGTLVPRPCPAQLRLSGWPAAGPAAWFGKSQRWPLPVTCPTRPPQLEGTGLHPRPQTWSLLVPVGVSHLLRSLGHPVTLSERLLLLCRGFERQSPF